MKRDWEAMPEQAVSMQSEEFKGPRLARRSLRAAFAVAMLVASTCALAGVPGLIVNVTSLAPPVPNQPTVRPISYSVLGGATYQTAYKVEMTATSPVGAVYFYLYSSVTNALSAPFDSTVSGLRSTDNCASPVGVATELDCAIGPIQAGSTISFTVLLTSPQAPIGGADSVLSVSWAAQTGQGQPNPSNLVHKGTQDVTLHVGSAADGVQSFVQPGQPLAVADNGSTTGVTSPQPVTVGVSQVALFTSCASHNVQCFESTVRIVDDAGVPIPFSASSPLLIDLVRAASSLKKNARIENATLSYTEVFPDGSLGTPQQIYDCINGPAWEIPSGQSRCVVPAVRKATTLTYTDAAGNWHFRIIALSNGRIGW